MLDKAKVTHRSGPWRPFEAVEFATLNWVDWFTHRRLMRSTGYMPAAETKDRCYTMLDHPTIWPHNSTQLASGNLEADQLLEPIENTPQPG